MFHDPLYVAFFILIVGLLMGYGIYQVLTTRRLSRREKKVITAATMMVTEVLENNPGQEFSADQIRAAIDAEYGITAAHPKIDIVIMAFDDFTHPRFTRRVNDAGVALYCLAPRA